MIVLYSEDRQDCNNDLRTMKELMRRIALIIEGKTKTQHLEFEPNNAVYQHHRICGASWKNKLSKEPGERLKRTTLIRDIATELLLEKIVAFHVDGDVDWAQRKNSGVWKEWVRFKRDICNIISNGHGAQYVKKIMLILPFYSIESWAYSNGGMLSTIVVKNGNRIKDKRKIASWKMSDLDEIKKIKEAITIGDKWNHELISDKNFNANALYRLKKSFYYTVERVRNNNDFVSLIRSTVVRPY